jgi:hypothetical protein
MIPWSRPCLHVFVRFVFPAPGGGFLVALCFFFFFFFFWFGWKFEVRRDGALVSVGLWSSEVREGGRGWWSKGGGERWEL